METAEIILVIGIAALWFALSALGNRKKPKDSGGYEKCSSSDWAGG